PFVDATAAAGAEVLDLNLAAGYDLRPGRLLRSARALRSTDALHLHGFNPALASICLAARRPIVFTEHGNFALGRSLRRSERLKRRLQARFLARRVAVVASNSRHTASRMAEIYGIPVQRVKVVHNGTDFDSLARPSYGPKNHELRVVFLGRLVPFKRVDRLIEGVARSTRRDHFRLN